MTLNIERKSKFPPPLRPVIEHVIAHSNSLRDCYERLEVLLASSMSVYLGGCHIAIHLPDDSNRIAIITE